MAWLFLFLCFLGLELFAGCLVSLWFCAGCLGAWLGGLAGVSFEGQLALFVALSFLALILLRPAAFWMADVRSRGRGMFRRGASGRGMFRRGEPRHGIFRRGERGRRTDSGRIEFCRTEPGRTDSGRAEGGDHGASA